MIQIYDYDANVCCTTIDEITAEIKFAANEFPEAVVEITTAEYYERKDCIVLQNILKLSDPQQENYYRITQIDVQQKYCTITAQHILCTSKKCYCDKWEYDIEKQWTLYELVLTLSYALGETEPYCEFSNKTVYGGTEYGVVVLDVVNPETWEPSDARWYYTYTNVDWYGKSLNEILNELKDMTELYITCFDNATFCFSFASYSEMLNRYGTYSGNYLPQFYTSSNAQNFEYKLKAENFVGASRAVYNYEINNRIEKETQRDMSGIRYNNWYNTQYGSTACMRYFRPTELKSEIEWNRAIDMWCNVYYVSQGDNVYQIRFEMEYSSDHDKDHINLIEIPIYNILKEQISTATGFVWNATRTSATVAIRDEYSTTIGNVVLYPIPDEEKKFTVRANVTMNAWGGVNFNFAPSAIQWHKIQDVAQKPEKEFNLYDVFGKDFGVVDFESFTETDSGDPSVSTPKIWLIKYTDKDDNIVVRGHIWLKYQQNWNDYYTAITTDINTQLQSYVDSYSQKMLESVNVTPQLQGIDTIIYPSDNIKVWSHEVGAGVTLRVEAVTYDIVNKRYTQVNTGFKKKNLRELDVELSDIKKRVKKK